MVDAISKDLFSRWLFLPSPSKCSFTLGEFLNSVVSPWHWQLYNAYHVACIPLFLEKKCLFFQINFRIILPCDSSLPKTSDFWKELRNMHWLVWKDIVWFQLKFSSSSSRYYTVHFVQDLILLLYVNLLLL